MSSDYESSDNEIDYFSDEEMIDGTQDQGAYPTFPLLHTRVLCHALDEDTDEMDMDNFGDDFKVTSKGRRKSYEVEYESLSQQAIERLIAKDVDHICGIFGVDVSLNLSLQRFQVVC